jgi:hypothetical protein
MDAADVIEECFVYADSVAFFFVFQRHLDSLGLEVEVEHDFVTPDGRQRVPDFVTIDGGEIVEVIEHKGSLPWKDFALKELNSVAKKYSEFRVGSRTSRPQVSVVYPSNCGAKVDKIRDGINSELGLYTFDQTTSDTEISFQLQRGPESTTLKRIVAGGAIQYDPIEARSSYKYLRAEPPVPYTAIDLWAVLSTFRGLADSGRESFRVRAEDVRTRHSAYYPPWIRNNLQLNSSRLGRGLRFLSQLGFVESSSGPVLTVFPDRGSRSGELLQYFSNKYASSRVHTGSQSRPKRAQMSLDSF